MEKQYKVVITDDSALVRKMVTRCLDGTEFNIVGEGTNGNEAVELFKNLSPDLVILDVIMPDADGLHALKGILDANAAAKVIMLTSMGTEDVVTECLTLGASNFIQKPFEDEVLLQLARKTVAAT